MYIWYTLWVIDVFDEHFLNEELSQITCINFLCRLQFMKISIIFVYRILELSSSVVVFISGINSCFPVIYFLIDLLEMFAWQLILFCISVFIYFSISTLLITKPLSQYFGYIGGLRVDLSYILIFRISLYTFEFYG